MALDYQQIRDQIRKMGENAPYRAIRLRELRELAFQLLRINAVEAEALQQKVDTVVGKYDPNLRCALPINVTTGKVVPLDASFTPPNLPDQATILAADGSQILPDRHEATYFGLINVGAIEMQHGSPKPPLTTTRSQLFYDEELFDLSEALIALKRDLNERKIIAEFAKHAQAPVITVCDGPLELWGAREGERSKAFKESLDAYIEVLQGMRDLNVAISGYVDKPAANLVVRLLEVSHLDNQALENIRDMFPLRGVSDNDLFRILLKPGGRSSVFAIQSRSSLNYQGTLGLHFFYLNVGKPGNPWIARVEIPEWVASNPQLLDNLHAILVHQCQIMGSRAYPYLLHRAHEAAVVTIEEKEQISWMINQELRNRGVPVGEASHKGALKDMAHRKNPRR